MPELRWILLFLGAVLIAGLWWWELRRTRGLRRDGVEPVVAAAPLRADRGEQRVEAGERGDRTEPSLDGGSRDYEPVELASIRVTPDERRPLAVNPPVLTIDDLPDDPSKVELSDDAPPVRATEPMIARRDEPLPVASATPPAGAARTPAPRFGSVGHEHASPASSATAGAGAPAAASTGIAAVRAGGSTTTRALPSRPAAPRLSAGPAGSGPASGAGGATVSTGATGATGGATVTTGASDAPGALQRIVAIRLLARTEAMMDGAELRAGLEAEGLRFGKYSIFHRSRADGRTIYSVASLVEPGSFDIDQMDELLYPGVSLFAVFPGPLDAPEAFDELLASARRLANRLDSVIQDERGAPFTPQRALVLREELVHFQGLVTRARQRT